MYNMKKAQGMSLKVIIIAVIALIILVVLIMIFTGKIKFFGSQTTETSTKFTGNNCQVPGTNNKCYLSPEECREQGGSYDDREYKDCYGCCLM
jgi:uncharacterized membrane protein YqiK